jgi:uncharacterized protein (TIGR03437 family)
MSDRNETEGEKFQTMRKTSNHLLSRRETLRLLGAAGAAALTGAGRENVLGLWPAASPGATVAAASNLPNVASLAAVIKPALFTPKPLPTWPVSQLSCVARPSLTEGPFFVDELLNRSDIRSDPSNSTVKAGVPLKIKLNIGRVSGSLCTALAGVFVDLWHCDASGGYSDVSGQGNPNNIGQKFLRGYQVTDSNGSVEFTTIYPGWYSGRTVHMHYKVRLFAGATRTYDFTSQLCFDDTLTDQVFTQAPYNARGTRNTRNSNDNIYQSAGPTILLSLTPDGAGGYTTSYDLGLSNVPDVVAGISTVSAASFASGGSLAPAAIAALFGTGLATTTASADSTPLPTALGGVQVYVRDASGTTRTAPLFFVSPTQINFQIPPGTSTGSAVIYVLRDSSTVGQGTARIETIAPGLFAASATGQGVAAALVLRVRGDGAQSYEAVAQFDQAQNRFVPVPIDLGPATDRLFLIGFGTGFRNRSSLSAVTATLGGAQADVAFAGSQGSFVGLDQANMAIPRSLAGRGDVDLVLSVDGQTANTVSINIK